MMPMASSQLVWLAAGLLLSSLCGGAVDPFLIAGSLVIQSRQAILSYVDCTTVVKYATYAAVLFAGYQAVRLGLKDNETPTWHGLGKPAMFPCKTAHARVFPKKHSFTYSYLVIGIPVGWEGTAGGMVSSGVKEEPSPISRWFSLKRVASRKGWFDIDPADYLERGNRELGLRGKLDAYLESQNVDPSRYPHAYLVTAARFLGYHFNPVSFWYLYGADKRLSAMILEVNNTFDERRMYFLMPDEPASIEAAPSPDGAAPPSPTAVFTQTWPKDFHVSPFNSRKGSYSLTSHDFLAPGGGNLGMINNTIVLRSSKSHGKLVARLTSDGSASDPTLMTPWQKLCFLASWWWVGFVTFPRIAREAGKLFFTRKLHVWFRPEPLKDSIGRNADALERRLELAFRKYLRHLVEASPSSLAVKYIPSGISNFKGELILSAGATQGATPPEEIEFKVLTPVFYSRFVHYAHDLEAIFCELRESCTLSISRPDLLPKFLFKKTPPTLHLSNPIDYAYLKAVRLLRQRPPRIERPLTWPAGATAGVAQPAAKMQGGAAAVDIRGFRISSMDGYVLGPGGDAETKRLYRGAVLRVLLADWIALGMTPVLDVQFMVLRGCIAWGVASVLGRAVRSTGA